MICLREVRFRKKLKIKKGKTKGDPDKITLTAVINQKPKIIKHKNECRFIIACLFVLLKGKSEKNERYN